MEGVDKMWLHSLQSLHSMHIVGVTRNEYSESFSALCTADVLRVARYSRGRMLSGNKAAVFPHRFQQSSALTTGSAVQSTEEVANNALSRRFPENPAAAGAGANSAALLPER